MSEPEPSGIFRDRDGTAITAERCEELLADPDYRRVDVTEVHLPTVGHWRVSTVWLAVDSTAGLAEQPILFETAVFALPSLDLVHGLRFTWPTELLAYTGHAAVVAAANARLQAMAAAALQAICTPTERPDV